MELSAHFGMFDSLARRGAYQFENYVSASQYLLAYDMFDRHVPRNSAVLDWGAGQGHFSYFLTQREHRVTAFSLYDDEMCKTVIANVPNLMTVVDPSATKSLPFDNEGFDAVTSVGVLEHVRETGGSESESLGEIRRVLKSQGVFFLYHFPNKYSWIEAMAKYFPNKHHHEFRYTKKDVENLAAAAGFSVVEHRRYGVLPRLMFRFLPNTTLIVNSFNRLDKVLSALLPWIAQNHAAVLKKR